LIGVLLTFWVGFHFFQLATEDILRGLIWANLAALISLLLTLKMEKIAWVRSHLLNRSLKTWLLLSSTYCGILLWGCSFLRSGIIFVTLFLPLLLSTGFAILIFGPIQDFLVRRQQMRKS
jgi:hypothetical protein